MKIQPDPKQFVIRVRVIILKPEEPIRLAVVRPSTLSLSELEPRVAPVFAEA